MIEVSVDRFISGTQSIGTRWPAFATSTGNAIMAHLPSAEVEAILQAPMPQLTPKTITSPKLLRQRLEQIRKDGYAVSEEALELGFTDIGGPIRNHDGYPVAAIGLSGAARPSLWSSTAGEKRPDSRFRSGDFNPAWLASLI